MLNIFVDLSNTAGMVVLSAEIKNILLKVRAQLALMFSRLEKSWNQTAGIPILAAEILNVLLKVRTKLP